MGPPKTNRQLAEMLHKQGQLKTPEIIDAFKAVDRGDFTGSNPANEIYLDRPLPIGEGQTISQPSTVAFMLEQLRPQRGQKILDIGAGSGWTTALLAQIVGKKGRVIGVELLLSLAGFAQSNLSNYNLPQAEIRHSSGWEGLASESPFDRILVSAAAEEVPPALPLQLGARGILVLPVKDSILVIEQLKNKKFQTTQYQGFSFVPLRKGGITSYGTGVY